MRKYHKVEHPWFANKFINNNQIIYKIIFQVQAVSYIHLTVHYHIFRESTQ